MKIAVAGTGYVGLSIATLLSQHHEVTAVDVIPEKVEKINNRVSPIFQDIGSDLGIGAHYNNTSFDHGGHCLIKDAKQLLANCLNISLYLVIFLIIWSINRINYCVNSQNYNL